jgi:hypothetical protein
LQATGQEVTERRMKPTNVKIKAAFIKLEETITIWIWEGNTYNKNSKEINRSKKEENQQFMSCPCQQTWNNTFRCN